MDLDYNCGVLGGSGGSATSHCVFDCQRKRRSQSQDGLSSETHPSQDLSLVMSDVAISSLDTL